MESPAPYPSGPFLDSIAELVGADALVDLASDVRRIRRALELLAIANSLPFTVSVGGEREDCYNAARMTPRLLTELAKDIQADNAAADEGQEQ